MYTLMRNNITGKISDDFVRRTSDGAIISKRDQGRDYQAYRTWAAGQSFTFDPAAPYAPLYDKVANNGSASKFVVRFSDGAVISNQDPGYRSWLSTQTTPPASISR